MPIIHDDEFGKIVVRRSTRATQVRLRVAPDGTLRASLPVYAPLFLVKRLIKSSRQQLRELQEQSHAGTSYEDGMQIGKSHTLVVRPATSLDVARRERQVIISLPPEMTLSDSPVIQKIKEGIAAALRVEAKSYLPRRLSYLANQHGYSYSRVRFSHASGRWGSCSTEGTISLNIALMKLPLELIDYVLIHELAHTQEMNHGPRFWEIVKQADPNYKDHRRQLKNQTPSI